MFTESSRYADSNMFFFMPFWSFCRAMKQMGWDNEPDLSDTVSILSTGWEPGTVRQQPSHNSTHLHLSCRGKLSMRRISDAADCAGGQAANMQNKSVAGLWQKAHYFFSLQFSCLHCLTRTIKHEIEISHAGPWERLPAVPHTHVLKVRQRETLILVI